jgi:hypothetical protein
VKRTALAMLWLALFAAAAHASEACRPGTPQERAACKPDVMRLCGVKAIALAVIGDCGAVYVCLRIHRGAVSLACDRVLKSHGY